MIVNETVLSGAEHPGTKLEVIHSSSGGWYVGFFSKDGTPYSRESRYFRTRQGAESLLSALRSQ